MNAFLLMRGVATYLHGYTVRYIPLHTVTLKKSVCTGHFRYPAIMSAKTP